MSYTENDSGDIFILVPVQGVLADYVIKRGTLPLDYNIMISYKDAVNVGIYRIMNVSI